MLNSIFASFSDSIYYAFLKDSRYTMLIDGLWVSLAITLMAVVLGVIIGLFLSICKISKTRILAPFADGYIAVIRGTPVVVQLTFIYFVVFANAGGLPTIVVAGIAFGINCGAYVAEIIRAGIQAVPKGQMEAARSLGMSYGKAMRHVIIPQAVKNILPALGNEFIVLLKETSVAGYIALNDLNRGALQIRNITYDAFTPLIAAAYLYFLLTAGLSAIQRQVERRLSQSD
ncbi:MAG: amino acid ABC transporter permease [Christensenellales bacterium]